MRIIIKLGAVLVALVAVAGPVSATATGAEACANEQARSESGSKGLPDCRMYELVSSTEKAHNAAGVRRTYSVGTSGYPVESSPEGDAVTYIGEQFYEALSGSNEQEYLSARGPGGWTTKNLMPADGEGEGGGSYVGFSPAAAAGMIYREAALAPGVPAGYEASEPYLRTSDGSFTPLITVKPPNRSPLQFGRWAPSSVGGYPILERPLFVGASTDYRRVFFEANDALTPNAIDGGEQENNIYEWSNGALYLVNVLPDGSTQAGASVGIEYGDQFDALDGSEPSLYNAVSQDGSRVYWTDESSGDLYVRENSDQPASPLDGKGDCTIPTGACTVLVADDAQFQAAIPDGSIVLFTKGGDLYEYELESAQTTDLAPGGDVQGLVGVSDDGSYVYFVAQAVLAPGASTGLDNLYLRHAGTTTFIATLSPKDNEYKQHNSGEYLGVWFRTFAGRVARVSPDGQYLAFVSSLQLTSSPIPVKSEYAHELYLYDATTGKLSCASCRLDGKIPLRPAELPLPPAEGGGIHQVRWLDDSGQVFFFSEEELIPGTPESGLYEYEEGRIYLLAASRSEAGEGPSVSFLDASESGDDVFFRTTSELVPEDQDELGDIYDARVNGRLPPAVQAPCVDEECQGEATPPFAAPGLATIALGPSGNLTPAPPIVKPVAKGEAKKHSKAKKRRRTKKGQTQSRRRRRGRAHR